MLEIRYDKTTKISTGWCGDESQFGNLKDRGNEVITIQNIPIPASRKPPNAWLYDELTQSLIPNPDYVEPKPPRDSAVEIDALKVRIEKLEKLSENA